MAKPHAPDVDVTPGSPTPDLQELRNNLGARVRSARAERGLSMRALANATGVSSGFISQLENGRVMPSVATLVAISRHLGLKIGDLFDATPAAQVLLRKQDRKTYEPHPGIRDEVVSVDPRQALEVIVGYIEPGSGTGPELFSHGADTECVLVISGTLDVFVDRETYTLGAGDALTFSGDLPHGYRNPGERTTEVVWTMTPATY